MSEKHCDPDDVVCQMEVLRHLKGLEESLGKAAFAKRYPELVAIREKLPDEIAKQETVLAESLSPCVHVDDVVVTESTVEDEEYDEE